MWRRLFPAILLLGAVADFASAADCAPLLDHSFPALLTGKPQSLCQYKGKVVLVVNTASACGYTPQYVGLEALYKRYAARGLVVIGFPSNDFGAQEPGSNKEVAEFCQLNYGVSFPMLEKTVVTGESLVRGTCTARRRRGAIELSQISDRPQRHPRQRLRQRHRSGQPAA